MLSTARTKSKLKVGRTRDDQSMVLLRIFSSDSLLQSTRSGGLPVQCIRLEVAARGKKMRPPQTLEGVILTQENRELNQIFREEENI